MKTQFLLPAGIALGVHAFLLLGFTDRAEPMRSNGTTDPVPDRIPIELPPLEPDPVETFEPEDRTERKETPVLVLDSLPTTFSPDHTGIVEVENFPRPSIPGERLSVIPKDWTAIGGPGDGKWGRTLGVEQLDNIPRALYQPAPDYPINKRTEAANVVVEFIVARDGTVANARIVSSSDELFEEACLRAVRRWRFEPGLKGGAPVPFRVAQPFVFHARE